MSKKVFKLSFILLILVFVATGCSLPWEKADEQINNEPVNNEPVDSQIEEPEDVNKEEETQTNDIKQFADYDELKKFLEENVSSNSNSPYMMRGEFMEDAVALKATSAPSSESAPEHSTTNNQVAGVDEADIIKTDGNYVYALVKNDLSIIKANPLEEMKVVSVINFKDRPLDIFINNKSLVVFGHDNQVAGAFRRYNSYTFFKVFDVTDPVAPKQVRDLSFEGNYTNSRMIGDYVYFIVNNYINNIDDGPVLPVVLENGEDLTVEPPVFYFDIPYQSYSYTSVMAINIKSHAKEVNSQVYLLDNGQNFYVSQNNIYITYTQRLNEYDIEREAKRKLVYPNLSADDKDKIVKIEASPGYILSDWEKKNKVDQILNNFLSTLSSEEQTTWQNNIETETQNELALKAKDREKTIIHKIGIKDDSLEYKAKGEVNGHVLNQFSMDENRGYFRVATTRSQLWSRFTKDAEKSYSNVYVLDPELKLVGSLENLATDERIYSARFMGDRAYLVTFKQVDPLFVINLTDPAKPAVLGAIKIPGFSNYLHPVNDSGAQLIGLGRHTEIDENDRVRTKGIKLSLFDFTDLSAPKELDSYIIGDERSASIALNDHRAFLFSAEKNILSIPAVLRESGGRLAFAGSLVFGLENNAFSLKGRIDHSDGGKYTEPDYWRGYSYYDNTVKRSLYIGDNLFTFSNKYLKVNKISDLSEVNNLKLIPDLVDHTVTNPPEDEDEDDNN